MEKEETPQKPTKIKLKPKQRVFIEAYIKYLGHITKACEKAKVDRSAYYYWMEHDENFRQGLSAADEHHNDAVHMRILDHAMNKDKEMLKFWAKHKMKHRGFEESTNHNVQHSGNVQARYVAEVWIAPHRQNDESKKPDKDNDSLPAN